MYPRTIVGAEVRGPERNIRSKSAAKRAPGRELRLGGALLCAIVAGCVTQTRTLDDTPGPQWQPGATPAIAAKPPKRPAGNKPTGDASAATSPSAATSTTNPAAAANPTAAAEPSSQPPAEPQLGQLQLLSPQDPAGDAPADSSPNPIERRPTDSLPRPGTLKNPPRVRLFYAYSAIFAAGRCRFASCAQNGWNTPHAEGDSESRCHANDCLQKGWTTTHPDGSTAETRCRAGGCAQDGWTTSDKDAASDQPRVSAETRCLAAGCFTAGWSTTYSSGTTVESHCHSKNCLQSGWNTRFPSGDIIECRCNMQDCAKNGAECT